MSVCLGLGSNVGDRRRNLTLAIERLSTCAQIEAVSSLYETDPVGPQDQNDFYNAACCGTTDRSAQELVVEIKEIERDLGRTEGPRWGPRVIDIDILLYGDRAIDETNVKVPHPEMANRAFVLVPLAEIAPDARHPLRGRTVRELAERVDASGVRLVAGPGWERR